MRTLEELRREIDAIDDELVTLVAKRMAIATEVVTYKKAHDIPVYIQARVDEVMSRNLAHGEKLGVSPELIRSLYQHLIMSLCEAEERLMQAKK